MIAIWVEVLTLQVQHVGSASHVVSRERAHVYFVILATISIARMLLDLYLMQHFIIRWRVWLTNRLTADWLDHRAYYRPYYGSYYARSYYRDRDRDHGFRNSYRDGVRSLPDEQCDAPGGDQDRG